MISFFIIYLKSKYQFCIQIIITMRKNKTIFLLLSIFTVILHFHIGNSLQDKQLATTEATILNYEMLNQGEVLTLSLQSYFNQASQAQLDLDCSSQNITDTLSVSIQKNETIIEISRMQMTANVLDVNKQKTGKTISLKDYKIIQTKTIYNQPNKVFLLQYNLLLVQKYDFNTGERDSFLQAIEIVNDTTKSCNDFQIVQKDDDDYIVVTCIPTHGSIKQIGLHLFMFKKRENGFIETLIHMDYKQLIEQRQCDSYRMYSFHELILNGRGYYNQIMLYCNSPGNRLEGVRMILISLRSLQLTNQIPMKPFLKCLQDTQGLIQYEDGFLSISKSSLKEYSYRSTELCPTLFNIKNYSFVCSIKDKGIQYVYIIFATAIIIKESYSPNYQNFTIDQSQHQNLHLSSYAICRKFLSLLYFSNSYYKILLYDLSSIYPKLIDTKKIIKQNKLLSYFSVFNYLQNGNYFFIYDRSTNEMSLLLYKGYQLGIGIINSTTAIGNKKVCLKAPNEKLQIQILFRSFDDVSVVKSNIKTILTYRQTLNVKLNSYIMGPLGKFYNYPNKISAFQYINYYNEIDILTHLQHDGKKLLATSIVTELKLPIVSFYYSNGVNLCDINFQLKIKKPKLSNCQFAQQKQNTLINFNHKKIVNSQNDKMTNLQQIVALNQIKYLRFQGVDLELCTLQSNNEVVCKNIYITNQPITKIKLITFSNQKDKYLTYIECFLIFKKQLIYCQLYQLIENSHFLININLKITSNQLQELNNMEISNIYFDKSYTTFLVVHLINKTSDESRQKVLIYDRPIMDKNSSSTLIGHIIHSFDSPNIEGVLCWKNLLILILYRQNQYSIEEYKISSNYRLKYNRLYPLYNHAIANQGHHYVDQQFIYIEVLGNNNQKNKYLVYCPKLSSINMLTHQFEKQSNQLQFVQRIGLSNNNSMGINGNKLFALALPNLVFKFETSSQKNLQKTVLYNFNVSVVDSNHRMNILPYSFTYDSSKEVAEYGIEELIIEINQDQQRNVKLMIDTMLVSGPVNTYNLVLDDKCSYFDIKKLDIFTKLQCLLYYEARQYGTMQDFVSFLNSFNHSIQIIVTQSHFLLVKDKHIQYIISMNKVYGLMQNAKLIKNGQYIIVYYDNTSSLSRQIRKIQYEQMRNIINNQNFIALPEWFKYQNYQIIYYQDYFIFQVPIRYQNNKIYYKTFLNYTSCIISDNYSLLKRMNQEEFQSIDTSAGDQLFFLLENGIGVYNLTEQELKISPSLWISLQNLTNLTGTDQKYVYIKYLQTVNAETLLIELGAQEMSYQIIIQMQLIGNKSQNRYELKDLRLLYRYEQYVYCKNTIHSQSQKFGNLIIKICNYQPQQYFVYSNFISITNEGTNSLIQFYSRKGTSSFPFRIQVIYSNLQSNDNFDILGDTLIVGSLFNLMCYYRLATTVTWFFSLRDHINASVTNDLICSGSLILANQHSEKQVMIPITVIYDYDEIEDKYWTLPQHYIQRIAILLIVLNTLRIICSRRKLGDLKIKKKLSSKIHSRQFEVMVKINSKKST